MLTRFRVGHQVGDLAQRQYPDGVMIEPVDRNWAEAIRRTTDLVSSVNQTTLFEATFTYGGIMIRADILNPVEHGWHMIEVKSTTSVKEYHLEDVAIQAWTARNAGLSLTKVSVQTIDSGWTYRGGGNYDGLFKLESVEMHIAKAVASVPRWIDDAREVLERKVAPEIKMGAQCNDPFACPFQDFCKSLVPQAIQPINWLPRMPSKKLAVYEMDGVSEMAHLDPDNLTENQRKVWSATISNLPFRQSLSVDIRAQISGARYYIDFETIAMVVPLWEGTRPYQPIPFQWSCHIEPQDSTLAPSELPHRSFLDLSGDDPSHSFIQSLLETVGDDGPILVYNQSFEKRILRDLVQRLPDYASQIEAVISRVVDLLPITVAHYYHPAMRGSWSIKSVLPTLAPELNYANLEGVSHGGEAQEAYLEAIAVETTSERKREIESSLIRYCTRDTEAMVVVLRALEYESGTGD